MKFTEQYLTALREALTDKPEFTTNVGYIAGLPYSRERYLLGLETLVFRGQARRHDTGKFQYEWTRA
jgi:hypothetical protein